MRWYCSECNLESPDHSESCKWRELSNSRLVKEGLIEIPLDIMMMGSLYPHDHPQSPIQQYVREKKEREEAAKVIETCPQDQFFVVARLDGVGGPKKRHATLEEASKEAERLAKFERGVEFFVLAAVSSYRPQTELVHTRWLPSKETRL